MSTHLKLLQELRAELDELTGSEVVWDPYMGCRDKHLFPPIAFYLGCITCMDVVEPYHPDRVMPQLGMVQCIPQLPIAATTYRREEKIYKVSYNYTPEYFEQWESHLLASRYMDRLRTHNDPHCESEYVEWYSRISHRIIGNPAHRSTPNNPRSLASSSQQQAIDTALQAAIPFLQNGRPKKGSQLQLMYDTIETMASALGWRPEPQVASASRSRSRRR